MRLRIGSRKLPLLATAAVCMLLYIAAGLRYDYFISWQVFLDLLTDNAFLGIAAIGMTFVILTGGIDLSVGAMIAFTSVAIASLLERGVHPLAAAVLLLAGGCVFGALQGWIIHSFQLPPFIVTLGGMFLARGLAFVISLESIAIFHPFYDTLNEAGIPFAEGLELPLVSTIYLAIFLLAIYVAHYTGFGRDVYAIGGNEDAAALMGLPVGRTKICTYMFSGFCSALAGFVYTIYSSSGYASTATGLELDAIATVVIGGTLLSGGIGYVAGTFIGVLIFGIIQLSIIFEGTLSSWWTRIAIAFLLLCFILLQKAITRAANRNQAETI